MLGKRRMQPLHDQRLAGAVGDRHNIDIAFVLGRNSAVMKLTQQPPGLARNLFSNSNKFSHRTILRLLTIFYPLPTIPCSVPAAFPLDAARLGNGANLRLVDKQIRLAFARQPHHHFVEVFNPSPDSLPSRSFTVTCTCRSESDFR